MQLHQPGRSQSNLAKPIISVLHAEGAKGITHGSGRFLLAGKGIRTGNTNGHVGYDYDIDIPIPPGLYTRAYVFVGLDGHV